MTERGAATPQAGAHGPEIPASEEAWYLYGVTLAAGLELGRLEAEPAAGDARPPLELVTAGALAAVVMPVRAADFTPEALARRAEDPPALEAMVRSHNDVIAAVHADRAILPARFGSVYADRGALVRALEGAGESMQAQLERLHDADEWAVHVYIEQAALERLAGAHDSALRQLDDEIERARPGTRYLLERRRTETLATAAAAASGRLAAALYEQLAAAALDGQIRAAGAAPRGAPEEELLRAAFLVRRPHTADFLAVVDGLTDPQAGTQVECSGPWPPYSFVEPFTAGRS